MTATTIDTAAVNGTPAKLVVQGVHQDFVTMDGALMNVLNDVSLDIPDRKFVSFVGHSGCGKSTLLRIIAGLQQPTQGGVLFEGKQVHGPGADRGMVFQKDAVFPWLTVRQNVEFGLKLRKLPKAEVRDTASKWIDLVGLKGWENAYPKELSGGMRKRVDLARVYATTPPVMLMDEPFGALDHQTKTVMQEELLHLWGETQSIVVFVTHDLEEAVFLSDIVVVLAARPGRVKALVDIDLPRPRDDDMRLTDEFLAQKRRLHDLLKED